jgi:AraC-like DNA-binding protein
MLSDGGNQGSTFIRARALTGFTTLVGAQGGDSAAMLKAFGIDPHLLDNPENPLPLAQVARLIDHAASALDVPDFGLRLAAYQDISVTGAVAMIVRNSATLAEALDAFARNLCYHTPGASLRVEKDDKEGYARFRYDLGLDEDVPRRHPMELSYAVAIQFLRLTTGSSGKGWQVHFRHRPALTARAYRRHFGCPMTFGSPFDYLSFPANLLAAPINQASPELRAMAERYLRNVERRYPLDLRRQVLELVERQLAHGGGTIAGIAQLLGMHVRTLQRRLRVQGAFFEDLVDGARRKRAAEYLGYGAIPLAEVALLVGYSGQNALTEACKRWFGMTPQKYRDQCLSGGALLPMRIAGRQGAPRRS